MTKGVMARHTGEMAASQFTGALGTTVTGSEAARTASGWWWNQVLEVLFWSHPDGMPGSEDMPGRMPADMSEILRYAR